MRWKRVDVIGIPYGTRLSAIVLADDECHVWIATKRRGANYMQWRGTYLRIEANKRITRVTIDEDIVDGEYEMLIKEMDK